MRVADLAVCNRLGTISLLLIRLLFFTIQCLGKSITTNLDKEDNNSNSDYSWVI